MSDGPPESAHWRSDHAWDPGSVTGTGGPKLAPPSTDVETYMLCDAAPEARLWKSRYTLSLPGVGSAASHGRSVSASVVPCDSVQVAPPSSEYAVLKLIPPKSSSVSTIRPDGVVTMSTSVLATVWPAGSVGVCVQASPFVDPQTAAEPSAALLSIQKLPVLSIASRGSEKPFESGKTTVVNVPLPAAPADVPTASTVTVRPSSARSRR